MYNKTTITSFKEFWRHGLNQPLLPAGSSQREPAFDYTQIDNIKPDFPDILPEIEFLPSNWNDIMMVPLRSLLEYVQFGQTPSHPNEMERYLNKNFHFLDPKVFGNTANTILVSNDMTMSIQWHWDDDQNTYIIRIPNNAPIMVNIYKTRGRIESITGLARDLAPITIEDVDEIYRAFNIRNVNYL